jgi:hypothetical protein
MSSLIKITTKTFIVKISVEFTNANNSFRDFRLKVNISIPVDRRIPTN